MGTSWPRTIGWLVVATLAIVAAGLFASGVGAAPGHDVGAPPGGETGELKIVKNLGGGWPDGAFVFTWDCTDGQSGQATFPDDFTGANFISPQEYPIGTVCTVEETDGVLSVDDYNVTTSIEGTGFAPINPRDVPINNSVGLNTIQYMNELLEPEDAIVTIRKVFEGPAAWEFGFALTCEGFGNADSFALAGGSSTTFQVQVPAAQGDYQCRVVEEPLVGDWTVTVAVDGAVTAGSGSETVGTFVDFSIEPGDEVVVTFTNIPGYAAQPPAGGFSARD
jgi:hypothetical protein